MISRAYTSEAEYQLARAAKHDEVVAKHTATPWIAKGDEVCIVSKEEDQSFGMLMPIALAYGNETAKANAEFIVRACNEYDALKRKADAVDWLVKAITDARREIALSIGDINKEVLLNIDAAIAAAGVQS